MRMGTWKQAILQHNPHHTALPGMDVTPEPTTDRELSSAAMNDPEPGRRTEGQQAGHVVCDPTLGVCGSFVHLDSEDWLFDWETKVMLPTLPLSSAIITAGPVQHKACFITMY